MKFTECLKIGVHKLVNLALVGAALALIFSSILVYNTWPIYTATNIIPQDQAQFPAITFCGLSEGYKEDVLKANGIASIDEYNLKNNLNWTSNNTVVTQQQLFLDATFSLDEILKKIYIRFIKADDEGKFNEDLDLVNNQNWVTEQRHRKFGRCYTLSPDDRMRSLGIYYIKFEFLIDAKIYVHAKNQFLDLSGRMGYKLYIGERFESQVSVQEILQLEYKNVNNALVLSDSDKSCSHEVYDDCMYEKVAKVMKDNSKDHCTVPWIRDNRKICSERRDINTTFWIGWNRITNQEKDCLAPCRTTIVNIGAKNYEESKDKNISQFYLYFPSRVTRSEEHYLLGILILIGRIGGYLGLYRLCLWLLDLFKFNKLVKDAKTPINDGAEGASAAKDALVMLDAL